LAEDKGGPEVVEEKTIVFYEDELIAVKMEDGSIYVPVRRLCDNLGVDWSAQRRRINRDEVLSIAMRGVAVTTTPQNADQHGGRQEMACLPLDLIPGWLFGITTSRVNEDIRDKLIRYRRECFRVLWDAFKTDLLPELQEPATDLTPADQMVIQAKAVYDLARHQASMERWLVHHDRRLDDVEEIVEDLRLRMQGPDVLITDRQAGEIAAAVKSVAFELTQRDKSRNWYQSIYSELYRRFGVSSYKQVPADRFGAVMAWLKEYGEKLG
jgi:hypothetical protein